MAPSPVHSGLAAADESFLREQLEAIDGLDLNTGPRNMRGNITGYRRLLRQIKPLRRDAHKLIAAPRQGNLHEARHLTHTLNGAAGTLSLSRLQEATRALEENLLNADSKTDTDRVSHLMIVSRPQRQARVSKAIQFSEPLLRCDTSIDLAF